MFRSRRNYVTRRVAAQLVARSDDVRRKQTGCAVCNGGGSGAMLAVGSTKLDAKCRLTGRIF
jgi:hypothetical protein